MKTKSMKRADWHRLVRRSYTVRDCTFLGRPGRVSLLQIHKVTQPLWVREGYGRVCIADQGHSWVQAAIEGLPVWATAMFDRDGRFLQIYFDIARPPCFDDPDDPWFEDLYLDIVLTSTMELVVLDREELDGALAAGEIRRETYEFALRACDRVYGWLEAHRQEVLAWMTEQYEALRAQ